MNLKTRPFLSALLLTCTTLTLLNPGPLSAQAQTSVYTDLGSFVAATGPLTEINFEDLPGSASSNPLDWAADDYIPNPLTLHGVTFADPSALGTASCPPSTCQTDPDNPLGGNTTLSLHPGATVAFPVGTGGVMLAVEGMETMTFTLQVTDFADSTVDVDGQAVLDDATYLGVTSTHGIRQIEVVSVGTGGGPLVLSAVLAEFSDPDVTLGVWPDTTGDGGPSHGDIVFGSATVDGDMVDLRVRFLAPPFSECENHAITWCLNVDQNAATGTACGHLGADVAFTLSGSNGSLLDGSLSFIGALAGLDPCSAGWYDWNTNTLRLMVPLSLLSSDGNLSYAVQGAFGQKDATNTYQVYADSAPNAINFGAAGGFLSSIMRESAPFHGIPLCSHYREINLPVQASATVELFPELGVFRNAPVGTMIQSTYFKTTSANRRFRRGFIELTIPELPGKFVISHAALILPESRARVTYPKPPVVHTVSYYYGADLVINTADYARAATPISQTFSSDENLPTQTFSLDVTEAFNSDHEGETIGFRIQLAVDPTYDAMANFGTSFDPSTAIPPRLLIRISHARAAIHSEKGGTLVYSDTMGTEITVLAPAGSVTETTRLAYEGVATTTVASLSSQLAMDIAAAPGSLVRVQDDFTLRAYQSGRPQSGTTLQEPVTVTLQYSSTAVVDIDEDTLVLYHWNGSGWEYAACGPIDRFPAEDRLAVPVCHLSSQFALFGLPDGTHRVYLPMVLR